MNDFISVELIAYIDSSELTSIVACKKCFRQFSTQDENQDTCDTCLKDNNSKQ